MSIEALTDSLLTFNFQAFLSIVFIDLVMSGDNAIIIGMAAAGLPARLRRRAILLGIVAATILRILFSAIAYQLLSIIGLTLAGGLLLLWVAYKMWQELRTIQGSEDTGDHGADKPLPKTIGSAMVSIIVADVSMSLDNVLAVAGAAHDAPGMMIFGLALSVALMAFAANCIAVLLEKHRWLAYTGLAVVAYVALEMIYRGSNEVYGATAGVLF
jgi:YjbE family integral membrane protein